MVIKKTHPTLNWRFGTILNLLHTKTSFLVHQEWNLKVSLRSWFRRLKKKLKFENWKFRNSQLYNTWKFWTRYFRFIMFKNVHTCDKLDTFQSMIHRLLKHGLFRCARTLSLHLKLFELILESIFGKRWNVKIPVKNSTFLFCW